MKKRKLFLPNQYDFIERSFYKDQSKNIGKMVYIGTIIYHNSIYMIYLIVCEYAKTFINNHWTLLDMDV